MTYSSPDEHRSLSDWDPAPTKAQLASEQRKPPAIPSSRRNSDDFTADEVVRATAIKLKELRAGMQSADKATIEACMSAVGQVIAEERKAMRAELERELMQLRIEFLQQQLDATRNVARLKPVTPSGSLIA
jgi:hypothetical protein